MKHKENILKLRLEGKTYNEIAKELGCSKATISYHCGKGQKKKYLERQRRFKKENPLSVKIDKFKQEGIRDKKRKTLKMKCRDFQRRGQKTIENKDQFINNDYLLAEFVKKTFSLDEVLEEIKKNPFCYLTGDPIDYNDPQSYQFDHKIPVTKGGDNSFKNLGICIPQANIIKSTLTVEELLNIAEKILKHHGYKIEKPMESKLDKRARNPC